MPITNSNINSIIKQSKPFKNIDNTQNSKQFKNNKPNFNIVISRPSKDKRSKNIRIINDKKNIIEKTSKIITNRKKQLINASKVKYSSAQKSQKPSLPTIIETGRKK
jgi:hypothetical protein